MHFSKLQKNFFTVLKTHYVHVRCVSDIQKKLKNSYYSMHGDVLLSSLHLGQVLDQSADRAGDSIAVISAFQNVSKTYSEFKQEADKLASGFISIGLKRGDRIGICSPNCYEWPLAQYAAAKAGLILVNINPVFQSQEIEYCLQKVNCKAIVTWDSIKTQNYYDILCSILPDLSSSKPGKLKSSKLPHLENVIMITEDKKDGILNFKDVFSAGNKESNEMVSKLEKSIQFDEPANIQFTSGTTGMPKGATLSHHNIVNNALCAGRRFGFNLFKPVVCCHLPLFHSFGCVHGSVATTYYQGTCVIPFPGFEAITSLKAIEKFKCTTVFGSPTMFVDMIRNYKPEDFNIGCLTQAIIGGAATPATLVQNIRDVLKIAHIQIGYGSTETSPAISANRIVEDFENVLSGLMQPVEFCELKVIDDKGHVLPINTQGELCVRGHITFSGYWDDEEKTNEVLDKRHWYHTGDLATMNEDGFIKITGRKKDMIIRGGENIYPQEVENFISTHPSILEAHICGVPDERMGEEACAWINLKSGMKLTEEELKQFCKGKISNYKIPKYIVFVSEFPKTQSGKVKKFEMTRISGEMLKL